MVSYDDGGGELLYRKLKLHVTRWFSIIFLKTRNFIPVLKAIQKLYFNLVELKGKRCTVYALPEMEMDEKIYRFVDCWFRHIIRLYKIHISTLYYTSWSSSLRISIFYAGAYQILYARLWFSRIILWSRTLWWITFEDLYTFTVIANQVCTAVCIWFG